MKIAGLIEVPRIVQGEAATEEIAQSLDYMYGFLEWAGCSYGREKESQGCIIVVHESDCPFQDHGSGHHAGECHTGVNKEGKICFSCKHDACEGRTWKDYRNEVERQRGDIYSYGLVSTSQEPATVVEAAELGKLLESLEVEVRGQEIEPGPGATEAPITESTPESTTLQSVAPVVTTGILGDMPESVLDGRLGEICKNRLIDGNRFPIAYAWPALIAAAGVMVPPNPPAPGVISTLFAMTNSYTGLIGPFHSGKTQAINWANGVIGLPRLLYSEMRAGSSEQVLRKLNNMNNNNRLGKSLLINLDEWKHLFDKAGIEHSSFATFLQSAFNNVNQNVPVSGGLEIEIECALTLIGGIVQDEFGDCFGANSMGGLHDRFTFGLCPEGFNFLYRPWESLPEETKPIVVTIDRSVWDMIDSVRKSNTKIGREAEIAVRMAHIVASFDGRPVLLAKDCENSVKAFIEEQLRIRDQFRPNEGLTNDAKCANALLDWLRRNTEYLEIVPERKVLHGLRRTLARLGPGALKYAADNLAGQGIIWRGDLPDAKPYGGRKPKAYQLLIKIR